MRPLAHVARERHGNWFPRTLCVSIAILTFVVMGLTTPAAASLTFCNKTQADIDVSIADEHLDCDGTGGACITHVKGWWNLPPGTCKTPIGGELNWSDLDRYYYWAQSANGTVWAGEAEFCVDPGKRFEYEDSQTYQCDASHKRQFKLLHIGQSKDYSLNLEE